MGRQQSLVQLTGSVGNLTFYKTKDGFLARQKTEGVSRARMNSDPRFARTLENISEFSRVHRASKLLRIALRDVIVKKADRFMTRRLSSRLMEVLKSDPLSDRGARLVEGGDLSKLKGFEFNENGKVFAAIFAKFTASIDRATGVFSLDIPAFSPSKMIVHPLGATHFRIKITATSLNFENNDWLASTAEGQDIAVNSVDPQAIQLTTQLPADQETPLVMALCIDFFQSVNGKIYPLENGAFNGIAIVEANQLGD